MLEPPPRVTQRVQIIGKVDARFLQLTPRLDIRREKFGTEMNAYTIGPMPVKTFLTKLMPHHNDVRPEGPTLEECLKNADFTSVLSASTEAELQAAFAECVRTANISPRLVPYNSSSRMDPAFSAKPDLGFKVLFATAPAGHADGDEEIEEVPFDFWRTLLGAEAKKRNTADPFADNPKPESSKSTKTSKKSKLKSKKMPTKLFKSSVNPTPAGANSRGQVGMYSDTQFGHQHRRHLWQLIIIGPNARLAYYDRSGLIISESFNYTDDPVDLVTFFWLLCRMNSQDLGCDLTVRDATMDEMVTYTDAIDRFFDTLVCDLPPSYDTRGSDSPIYAVEVFDEQSPTKVREVFVGAPITTTRAVAGRGTRIYLAYDPKDETVRVLKDTWYPVHSAFKSEAEIYKILREAGVTGIPTVVCGGDVLCKGMPQETTVQEWARRPEQECPWRAPCGSYIRKFRHHRMLLEFVYPIECLQSSRELTRVMGDICRTISLADSLAGVVHRDITPKNIALARTASGWKGVLLDWDHAGLKNDVLTEAWPVIFCSATTHFMSIRLLEDPDASRVRPRDRSHTLADDMESVFWSFVWIALQYFRHTSPLLNGSDNFFDEAEEAKVREGPAVWYGGSAKYVALTRGQLQDIPFESNGLQQVINMFAEKWTTYHTGRRFEGHQYQQEDPGWTADRFEEAAQKGSWLDDDRSDRREFVPTPWGQNLKSRNAEQIRAFTGEKENVPTRIPRASSRASLRPPAATNKRAREDDDTFKFKGKMDKTQSGNVKITYWLRSGKTYKLPRPSGLTGPIKALGLGKYFNRNEPAEE